MIKKERRTGNKEREGRERERRTGEGEVGGGKRGQKRSEEEVVGKMGAGMKEMRSCILQHSNGQ